MEPTSLEVGRYLGISVFLALSFGTCIIIKLKEEEENFVLSLH